MLLRLPSSAHVDTITPVGTVRCSCRLSSRTANGLPLTPGGSAPTLPFSRSAQRLIQISACAVAELLNATLCHRSASNYVVTTMSRPGCYQPKRQLFGWASHPTRKTRLSTVHWSPRLPRCIIQKAIDTLLHKTPPPAMHCVLCLTSPAHNLHCAAPVFALSRLIRARQTCFCFALGSMAIASR